MSEGCAPGSRGAPLIGGRAERRITGTANPWPRADAGRAYILQRGNILPKIFSFTILEVVVAFEHIVVINVHRGRNPEIGNVSNGVLVGHQQALSEIQIGGISGVSNSIEVAPSPLSQSAG